MIPFKSFQESIIHIHIEFLLYCAENLTFDTEVLD